MRCQVSPREQHLRQKLKWRQQEYSLLESDITVKILQGRVHPPYMGIIELGQNEGYSPSLNSRLDFNLAKNPLCLVNATDVAESLTDSS